MIQDYLQSSTKQFKFAKALGDKNFKQLSDEQLFWQPNSESNSIAIIVNHLHGNMKSRWTDFLNSDGEKEWRKRDQEFEDIIKTREELNTKWEEGWRLVFEALESINENNFDQEVVIRNQGHSIIAAINRQLGHYSYHVGQIVFIGKMILELKWESLSIPKGKSAAYNASKFSAEKQSGHFSDEFTRESN